MFNSKPKRAFNAQAVDFCSALSKQLLTVVGEGEAAIHALGFWLRPANIRRIHECYPEQRHGLGCVFHMPPSNVPTLTFYSWISSLLAGNTNIVRLSSRRTSVIEQKILEKIDYLFGLPDFRGIREQNCFERYGYEESLNRQWLSVSQGAMLWGGKHSTDLLSGLCDEIAAQQKRNLSVLVFPGRASVLIVDLRSDENISIDGLVERVWRDTYPFIQQACSSPKGVVWVGSQAHIQSVQPVFWKKMRERLDHVNLQAEDWLVWGTEQAVFWQRACLAEDGVRIIEPGGILRVGVSNLTDSLLSFHPGCFSFLEVECRQLSDLEKVLKASVQTVTVWPVPKADVRQVLSTLGALRVVAAGHALDFDVVWDGKDIIQQLSVASRAT